MELSADLQALLKQVSRSFYLSLRFLPAEVRGCVSIAYLLARAADSLADHASVGSTQDRLDLLNQWPTGYEKTFLAQVHLLHVEHPGEQALLVRLGEVFHAWEQGEPQGQALIQKVLGFILQGLKLDLLRFPGALNTNAELEEYTYLVAGCVGEFWSEILAWKIPHWSTASLPEMRTLGKRYGQGLQLVNILRDAPEDAAAGRTYLPGPGTLSERRTQWFPIARDWLQAGATYVQHLQGWRLRVTADLPWQLGLATLDKLALAPDSTHRLKISRSQVRHRLFRSAWRHFCHPSAT